MQKELSVARVPRAGRCMTWPITSAEDNSSSTLGNGMEWEWDRRGGGGGGTTPNTPRHHQGGPDWGTNKGPVAHNSPGSDHSSTLGLA